MGLCEISLSSERGWASALLMFDAMVIGDGRPGAHREPCHGDAQSRIRAVWERVRARLTQ